MNTYTCKILDRTISIKAKKDDAERLSRALKDLLHIRQSWQEITGVIGGQEMTSTLYSPFTAGEGTLANPEQFEADKTGLFASIPDLVTADLIPALIKQAHAIYNTHLPIVDKRRTPEQEAERNQKYQEVEHLRQDKDNIWIDAHCQSRDKVTIPDGYMAVYIELNYDDSDSMTDYFDRHHGWGHDMLLAIVKKQPHTERLARQVISMYPELAALTWTWDTENYSMGHGNWLQSGVVGTADGVEVYRGGSNPPAWYEVQFNSWGKSMYAYKNYPGSKQAAPAPAAQDSPALTVSDAEIKYERDWTWIVFHTKPPEPVRETLKGMGARFSGKRIAWYFTRHVDTAELSPVLAV